MPTGIAPSPHPRRAPSNWWPAGRRLGRLAPVSRGSARLRLGLAVNLPAVGDAARLRHQGPLLAIPGHRPPARSPPRATCGTPPASSRGLPTAVGIPCAASQGPARAYPSVQQHLVDIKVRTAEFYYFPGHSPMDFFST
jgi:hypothetical protein